MNSKDRLVVILGPTASGKSALAIQLAKEIHGEVVVCDSTQVYRHFDIGTGKIAIAEQQGIAHHLVDLAEPSEVFTAGEFHRRALSTLRDIATRKRIAILTAGTGLYLRALLEGLSDAPERSETLRKRLRAKSIRHGPGYLHLLLKKLDPETAARIAPRDNQKIIRAIEMRLLAGKSVSEIHRRGRNALEGFQIVKIGLAPERSALYERIHQRIATMLAAGWMEEVRRLVAKGVSADAKPFLFIGYAQLRLVLEGQLSKTEAVRQIQQTTRRYAKRQITWFRREREVHWLSGFGDDPAIVESALTIIRSSLS
jgi:tRNA dimethylallyltransferase